MAQTTARKGRRSGNPGAAARAASAIPKLTGDDRRATIAIALMTCSVLVWIPGGFSRFVFAKLLVVAIACAVGASVESRARLHRTVTILFAVGAAWFVLTAVLGDTPLPSLLGRWPRYEGLPVLGAYAACAVLGARLLERPARVTTLVTATAGMSCALGVFSVLDVIGWSPLGESAGPARDGSVLGNATDQGLVGMIGVALLFRPAIETRRELYLFGIAGAAATVVMSGSRFALLATLGVLVFFALTRRKDLLWPVLGSVAVLAALALAIPASRDRLLNGHTVRGRLLAWDLSLPMVGDHPLTGWGGSRYVDAVGHYETRAWTDWLGAGGAPDSPHNWLLQVLLAGGIPLLACALALVILTGRLGWQSVKARPELAGIYAAVGAYGAAMLANFTNPTSTCLAAFLAGVLVSTGRDSPERTPLRWGAMITAGVAAVALLALCVSEVFVAHGISAAQRGDVPAARSAFGIALTLRAGDPDTHMVAAQSFAAIADQSRDAAAAAQAESDARASLDATPDTYESQVALGVALASQDDLEGAIDVLEAAVADFPQRPSAYVQRALARLGTHDVDGAVADLERAKDLGYRPAEAILRRIDR